MDPRIERAREVIVREADAVRQLAERLGDDFVRIVELVLELPGRIVPSPNASGLVQASLIP